MAPLNPKQAIWLARGAALGSLAGRLRELLRAALAKLPDFGFARKRLPDRLG